MLPLEKITPYRAFFPARGEGSANAEVAKQTSKRHKYGRQKVERRDIQEGLPSAQRSMRGQTFLYITVQGCRNLRGHLFFGS